MCPAPIKASIARTLAALKRELAPGEHQIEQIVSAHRTPSLGDYVPSNHAGESSRGRSVDAATDLKVGGCCTFGQGQRSISRQASGARRSIPRQGRDVYGSPIFSPVGCRNESARSTATAQGQRWKDGACGLHAKASGYRQCASTGWARAGICNGNSTVRRKTVAELSRAGLNELLDASTAQ